MTATHVFKRGLTQILDKQDPAIKSIVEFEDHKHSLNFLDINSTSNTTNKKYESKVNRKYTIPNIHIEPNSCIDSSIIKNAFRGFLHRAHTICSEKYVKEETHFIVDMFVENGHKKTFLETLVKDLKKEKNSMTVAITPTQRKPRGYLK